MKKILLGVAAAAMTLATGAATAQPYGYYERGAAYRDSDRDGVSDAREWGRDRDRDGRPDQYDRYDNRRGHRGNHYANGHRWRTGERYPYYRNSGYYISDYRAYNLPPPRHGYRYYRSDNGDVVLAAIATGLIASIIASSNDHDRYDRYSYYRR
jgi:Ni/Co efflux regulator RcnB